MKNHYLDSTRVYKPSKIIVLEERESVVLKAQKYNPLFATRNPFRNFIRFNTHVRRFISISIKGTCEDEEVFYFEIKIQQISIMKAVSFRNL